MGFISYNVHKMLVFLLSRNFSDYTTVSRGVYLFLGHWSTLQTALVLGMVFKRIEKCFLKVQHAEVK